MAPSVLMKTIGQPPGIKCISTRYLKRGQLLKFIKKKKKNRLRPLKWVFFFVLSSLHIIKLQLTNYDYNG